ncbi:helix-turn-helix domain-containing protein [Roseiarcaceae bacterium H3SJ34-1]|nr:helix-turn-helix domain-containing protein [Roseiarcaceae bacterium H3SJ34-1]
MRAEGADHGNCQEACRPLTDILVRIGDKWTVQVIGALSKGSLRYSQIFKQIEGVSQRMLTLTLKGLERDGLVTRTIYPTIPPRVDYALTDRGRTLIEPLHVLWTWAYENRDAIDETRRAFDQRRDEEASSTPRILPRYEAAAVTRRAD